MGSLTRLQEGKRRRGQTGPGQKLFDGDRLLDVV